MTEAHVFHELASHCPEFGTVCSDLSDICFCYWISGHGQRECVCVSGGGGDI